MTECSVVMESVAVAWVECPDTSGLWVYRYMTHDWVWDSDETRFALYRAMIQSGEYDSKGMAYSMSQAADISWGYAREDEELEDWVPCDADDPGSFKASWATQP